MKIEDVQIGDLVQWSGFRCVMLGTVREIDSLGVKVERCDGSSISRFEASRLYEPSKEMLDAFIAKGQWHFPDEENCIDNAEYINDARALLDTADLCSTPPAQARNLYIQAARILRACPTSSDWRESVCISNLVSYADECANLT